MRPFLLLPLLALACGSTHYPPLADGGCVNQHPACVLASDGGGPFASDCPSGSACFTGFCVEMRGASPNANYAAKCVACGPCVFTTGGFAGFSAPPGCRVTSSPTGCCDLAGSCELD